MDAELTPRRRLEAALLAQMRAADAPMQWGVDDCALWCADVLRSALGYDAASSFRGRYRTRIGARRVLGRAGLPNALRQAARRHGWRRVAPDDARCGDVGLMVMGETVSTMICRAEGWFVGRSEAGFTALPARYVKIAWAVVRGSVP